MALFDSRKNKTAKHRRRFLESPEIDPRSSATTVLSDELTFEGELRTEGDAVVAGHIEGNLEVNGRLLLVKGGWVRGTVSAAQARVDGIVDGPVQVEKKLEVGRSARITGDLSAAMVAIAEGALVRGALYSSTEPHRFVEKREGRRPD